VSGFWLQMREDLAWTSGWRGTQINVATWK